MPASKTRARTSKSEDPNAIDMLLEDHRRVEKLFSQFEKAKDPESCREIVETTCAELKIHTTLEEELFYPAAREALDDADVALIDEAEVEHGSAKQLIERLETLGEDDPHYAACFTVLSEYVKHHVKEEEGEMFKKVRKSDLDLDELAARMRTRKAELMDEAPETAEAD